MTIINSLRPAPLDGSQRGWYDHKLSKAIVDLLNESEAERQAVWATDPGAQATNCPPGVDAGGLTVLIGVLTALIGAHEDQPPVLSLVLRLIASYTIGNPLAAALFLAKCGTELAQQGVAEQDDDSQSVAPDVVVH